MTQMTSKNHGHPSAKTLLKKLSQGTKYYYSYRLIDSQVISDEEFKTDQYLYTKYIDELQRGLTKQNYDEWVLEELQRNALLRKFIHQEGVFSSDREKVVELLSSKRLSLFNGSDEVASQIVKPYGEQRNINFDEDPVVLAEQAVDKSLVTNIVMMGNQMLLSAINAFYSSEREENLITCAIACSSEYFRFEKAAIEKLQLINPFPGDKKVITGNEYCEIEGDTVLYVRQYTRRDKCKRRL